LDLRTSIKCCLHDIHGISRVSFFVVMSMAELIGLVTTVMITILNAVQTSVKKVEDGVKSPFIKPHKVNKSTQTHYNRWNRWFTKTKIIGKYR